MPCEFKTLPKVFLIASALLALIRAPMTLGASPPDESLLQYAGALTATFRGCDSAGWCRFWIESLDPHALRLLRVYPDGVMRSSSENAVSVAVRDRMNALLANMVHQHKRIVLHDLRKLEDGTFAATVTVNELNLAVDPVLLDLH